MSKDYYRILGINRRATNEEVRKAYHKLALKWHPDRNLDNKEEAEAQFKDISEAYQILTDPAKRKIYDDFGEGGLKAGLSGEDNVRRPQQHTYTSSSGRFVDPRTLFEEMFGQAGFSTGPRAPGFDDPMGAYESFLRAFAGFDPEQEAQKQRQQQRQNYEAAFGASPRTTSYTQHQPTSSSSSQRIPPSSQAYEKPAVIERPFACTLEELYTGCTRQIKFMRHVTVGKITKEEEKSLQIDVKPGWHAGTKLTFKGEGDVVPGQEPGDVCFILEEVPHPYFKREGSNIVYTANITLGQAFSGIAVRIPLLGKKPKESSDKKEKDGKKKHKHDKHKHKKHKGKKGESSEEDEDRDEDEPDVVLVKVRDIIHPKYEHKISGAGLPKSKKPGEFGDLIVRFDIKFPEHMTTENRKKLKEIVEASM